MATTTAAQRRAAEKEAFDAYLANCPSRKLLSSLSDKWVVLTICALGDAAQHAAGGQMRFSALQRQIAGVSQKMLTQTLRGLQRDGLINRTVTPTVPVTVEYALTDLGHDLLRMAISPIKEWAEQHFAEIERAQCTYDSTKLDR